MALEKSLYAKLTETESLTRELGEALERQDQVSVRMLMSMRRKPVSELLELQGQKKLKSLDLSKGDKVQFDRLAEGGGPLSPGEEPLVKQVAVNRRLLQRLLEKDRGVSQRLCGDRSYYRKSKKAMSP